jgi:acyl carrier protein
MNEAAVIAAIAAEVEVAPGALRQDARFAEDYGVDSLDFVRLVMAVEEAAGVKIEDKQAAQAATVGALLDLARLSQPAPAKT